CAGQRRWTHPCRCRSLSARPTARRPPPGSTPPRSRSCCRASTAPAPRPRSSDPRGVGASVSEQPTRPGAAALPAGGGTGSFTVPPPLPPPQPRAEPRRTWNNEGMTSPSEQQEWSRRRQEVFAAKEQALQAAREQEHLEATALIREAVERYRAAGIAPVPVRARP